MNEWIYWLADGPGGVPPKLCDAYLKQYLKLKRYKASVGGDIPGEVNEDIRRVMKADIDKIVGIPGMMHGIMLHANFHTWRLDISHVEQSEFLQYAEGGFYKSHIDQSWSEEGRKLVNVRKLSAICNMNDDYEGGRFYIQTGSERLYVPLTKGAICVFPSVMVHGIEPVEKGTRYSVVSWLLGPHWR